MRTTAYFRGIVIICITTMLVAGCDEVNAITKALAPATGGTTADIEVSSRVLSAMQNDSRLASYQIAVATQAGDVRLSGTVDTREQISHAGDIARAIVGVDDIDNALTIK